MALGNDPVCRSCRLLFAALLAFAWCGRPHILMSAQVLPPAADRDPAAAAAVPGPTPAQLEQVADRVERSFAALEAAASDLPRDTFDPAEIERQIGPDPQRLADWVWSHVRWVSYRGALRGAAGTLMDGRGNNLDRVLLLAELLQHAKHRIRIARADLSDAQAAAVQMAFEESMARPPAPRALAPGTARAGGNDDDANLREQSKRAGVDPDDVRRTQQQLSISGARLAEDVVQRVADQSAALSDALADAQLKTPADERGDADAEAGEDFGDYWWVQLNTGGDRWTDLHLIQLGGAGGREAPLASVEPRETFAPDTETGRFVLPADVWHHVRVRILAERRGGKPGAAPQEQVVLEYALRPADLPGQRVALSFWPTQWPTDLTPFGEQPGEAFADAAMAQHEWLPVLTVGTLQIAKSSISDAGVVDDQAAARLGELFGFSKAGSRVGNILGGGRIGGGAERKTPPADPPDGGTLTAVWIEYEIVVPGQPADVERRTVFDLVGPAARAANGAGDAAAKLTAAQRLERALGMLEQIEMLPLGGDLSPQLVRHVNIRTALANRDAMVGALRAGGEATPESLTEQLRKVEPSAGPLYLLALCRRAWSPHRDRVYLNRPNLLTLRTQVRPAAAGAGVTVARVIDVVANQVAVLDDAGAGAPEPHQVALDQGVLDTNAEAALAAAGAAAVPAPTAARHAAARFPVENVAELFARDDARGAAAWVLIRSTRDPAWAKLEASEDARARMAEDLAQGYALLAPPRPVDLTDGSERRVRSAYGWWRTDLRTGHTLGMLASGTGGTATEESMVMSTEAVKTIAIIGFSAWLGYEAYAGCVGNPPSQHPGRQGGCIFCGLAVFVLALLSGVAYVVPEAMGGAKAAEVVFLTGTGGWTTGGALGGVCSFAARRLLPP